MLRSQVSCFGLFLEVGGRKAKAEGGAESQPFCIPPADALLWYVGAWVWFQVAERTLTINMSWRSQNWHWTRAWKLCERWVLGHPVAFLLDKTFVMYLAWWLISNNKVSTEWWLLSQGCFLMIVLKHPRLEPLSCSVSNIFCQQPPPRAQRLQECGD